MMSEKFAARMSHRMFHRLRHYVRVHDMTELLDLLAEKPPIALTLWLGETWHAFMREFPHEDFARETAGLSVQQRTRMLNDRFDLYLDALPAKRERH